jgi:hypothetical protein
MNTLQWTALCAICPQSRASSPPTKLQAASSGAVIKITDIHTESGTHWLAVYLYRRSQTGYFFD